LQGPEPPGTSYLVVRVGRKLLALALTDVIETMRPLPVSTLVGVPGSVLGVAIIRGAPTPVIDAGALLGESGVAKLERFVSIRQGARRAALAVEEVLGVRAMGRAELSALPPLIQGIAGGVAESVAAKDEQLLLVLRSGRLVPEEVWRAMAREGSGGSPHHEP
jgi:purine-binding chemotaxis protein CheW